MSTQAWMMAALLGDEEEEGDDMFPRELPSGRSAKTCARIAPHYEHAPHVGTDSAQPRLSRKPTMSDNDPRSGCTGGRPAPASPEFQHANVRTYILQ